MTAADPMEFVRRAQAVKERVDRLSHEAARAAAAGDLERLAAIQAEVEVCVDGLHDIREEQLAEQLREREPRRRRWFRRWAWT